MKKIKNITVMLELTKRCNLKCEHCYLGKDLNTPDDLTTKDIKIILEQLKSSGVKGIGVTGGEPFLRKDVIQILSYADKLNFESISIMTNGTFITPKIIESLKKYKISVNISLYGHCANIHEKITRKKGSFKKTIDSIKKLKKNKIKVKINQTLLTINYKHILNMINLCKRLDVFLKFGYVIYPRRHYKNYSKYMLKGKKLEKALYFCLKNKIINLENNFTKKNSKFCSAGNTYCVIDSEGYVNPCIILPLKIGNVKFQTFKDIWNSKKFDEFRKYTYPKNYKKCKNCELLDYCLFCPGLSYSLTGKFKEIKEMCDVGKIFKKIII